MKLRVLLPIASLLGTTTLGAQAPTLRLPRLFGDGMVVQRQQPVVVWGWAPPGALVAVSFHKATARATATSAGTWTLTLPAEPAGGPFDLSVRSGSDRVDLHDVLVGDVWVASGQSNMEFPLALTNNAAQEIAAARDPLIRQLKVPTSWSTSPEDDLPGALWTRADPEHAGAFTAVGYFFARELRKSVDVPIGLINTTWGGSSIEAWLSRPAQRLDDSAFAAILRAEETRRLSIEDSLRVRLGGIPTRDSGLVGDRPVWADPSHDDARWTNMPVPSYWEPHGLDGMDGVAWYRTSFDVDANQLRSGITLSIAAIDDDDITWVNGVEVGRTNGYNLARRYSIPARALRAGRNVIAVRVVDGGGGGGINGAVSLVFADGTERSLAGQWKFKVAEVSIRPDGQRINKLPSVLYNKMLHPLLAFPIKGVLWYQGGSNANNMQQAAAYRGQFESLIGSWRHDWRSSGTDFPFLWVQLPNFGPPDSVPRASAAWATQRESMAAALALPNTGQAIAIDVGDANDIHPRNKQDVGARLARVARRVAYGQTLVASGPTYRAHRLRGDTVIVEFDNVARGLVSRAANGTVGGFALAGADQRFVWAEARIVGDHVEVWSARVPAPVAVRYAWANNPDRANLYNSEQLPAAPFRTDRW